VTAWDAPTPLVAAGKVPAFPVSSLPVWLREMVEATAVQFQVPADLPALLSLAAISSVAAEVDIQVRPGWSMTPNIYTAVALPPGSKKSPVYKSMMTPVVDVEAELESASRGEVARIRARKEMAEKRAAEAKSRASKAPAEEREALEAEAAELEAAAAMMPSPAEFRLLVEDVTPEQLATIMAEQNGRIALMSPEGGVFNMMAGQYKDTPNIDVYLKASGGEAMMVDRRGRRERIKSARLTVGLALQPEVLHRLGSNPVFQGRGLIERFFMSLPEDMCGREIVDPPAAPETVVAAYNANLTALARTLLDPAADPFANPNEPQPRRVINVSPEANEVLKAFEQLLIEAKRENGSLHHVREYASKAAGHTVKVAALLHLADGGGRNLSQPVSAETMTAAVNVGKYLIKHFVAVFGLMGMSDTVGVAERIAVALRRHKKGTISQRDIFNLIRSKQVETAADVIRPIELLLDRGHLRLVEEASTGPRGGRPKSPVYEVHPMYWEEPLPKAA
jgi:replicative DNA helicase